MAKQPETQDRFRLHFDTSREMMGVAIAELARMGINNVQYELITDVLAFQTRNAPRVFETDALDVARTFIEQHHTFKARELTKLFEEEGRSQSNGFSVIKKLVELGELRKLGGGHYQSTAVKALAAPEEATKPPQESEPKDSTAATKKRYSVSNIDLVWNGIKRRSKASRQEMTQILVDSDRPKSSVNGLTAKLVERGKLKALGEGWYDVIKQAKES